MYASTPPLVQEPSTLPEPVPIYSRFRPPRLAGFQVRKLKQTIFYEIYAIVSAAQRPPVAAF